MWFCCSDLEPFIQRLINSVKQNMNFHYRVRCEVYGRGKAFVDIKVRSSDCQLDCKAAIVMCGKCRTMFKNKAFSVSICPTLYSAEAEYSCRQKTPNFLPKPNKTKYYAYIQNIPTYCQIFCSITHSIFDAQVLHFLQLAFKHI